MSGVNLFKQKEGCDGKLIQFSCSDKVGCQEVGNWI